VWTPKRVLILVASLLLFLTAFGVYSFFFSGIDGLPPLPSDCLRAEDLTIDGPTAPNERELKIIQAFGKDCEELHRPIKLLVKDRGVVIAAGQFSIEESDGRVKLSPFSAAIFPKNKGDGGFPEINTVQCDFAYLTLDKPVQLPSELANRKVTAVELRGGMRGVTITNNRKTESKKDDIEIYVSMSPLFYEERRNLIWTEGFVKLLDFQSQPKPTEITAKGMELHLSPDSGPNKPKAAKAAAKPKDDNPSNIELLVLRSNVIMHLYVDANDGFLGEQQAAEAPRPAPAEKKEPPPKSHVFIKTNGPFTYIPPKELAWFDCPPSPGGGILPAAPEQVLVSREHPEKKFDQMLCDHLKLWFRKKAPTPQGPARDPTTGDKEIQTAVATARPGRQVVLTMDTQNLEADGNELHYYAAEPGVGPRTLLKGTPLRAVKNGDRITARELHLTGADKDGKGQRAYAKGPAGKIDLADKKNGPSTTFPVHITWQDTLVSTQERDGDKVYEMWTLTRDAAYIDEEQKQELRGQKIQLWLEPTDAARGGPKSSGGPKQKIHKVEAFDKVFANAQETKIKRANHLLIIFRPEIAAGSELPDLPAAAAPAPPPPPAEKKGPAQAPPPTIPPPPATAVPDPPGAQTPEITIPMPPPAAPPAEENKPRRPIELDADDVVIYVATIGPKKQLEELTASGQVHVVQEPEKADEKGLDITGDLLNLLQDAKGGKILTVYGDSRKMARLEMNDMKLMGPKVVIDEVKNRADVDGQGAMEMPSKTSLDGDRPARPGARMTIHWNKDMTFDGKYAHFRGGVLGYQDDSSLKCESMDAIMDRTVVFKEGQKANQGAKVAKLFCDRQVYVVDEQLGPDGKRQEGSILECKQLDVDNELGPTRASGPGRLRHLAMGDTGLGPQAGKPADPKAAKLDPKAAKLDPKAAAKKDREMQLTRIEFRGWMFSNTKAKFKNATFRDNVEVFRVPAEVFEVALDQDKLPPDGFFLKCEALQVMNRQAEQKAVQDMVARGQVYFRTPEVFGFSDVLKFDEERDLIIFEGENGNLVQLFKITPTEKKTITGEKILYNRKSGEFRVEKAGVIKSSRLDLPRGLRLPGMPWPDGAFERPTLAWLVPCDDRTRLALR
jgi:hypothetical protein